VIIIFFAGKVTLYAVAVTLLFMLCFFCRACKVWSNGKLKKVRGMARPTAAPSSDGNAGETARLSITVLITMPLDSVISPLLPPSDAGEEDLDEEEKKAEGADGDGDEWKFRSFLLEDYAWRVYHERLQFKDPLARYRI
jgi:hypothetical protein